MSGPRAEDFIPGKCPADRIQSASEGPRDLFPGRPLDREWRQSHRSWRASAILPCRVRDSHMRTAFYLPVILAASLAGTTQALAPPPSGPEGYFKVKKPKGEKKEKDPSQAVKPSK